jgi:long-chain fatty acid transport protein
MRRLCLFLFLSVLCFTACLRDEECLAGGFDNGIIGPRGSAMGTAFAGLADDPTAIFYNPAGVALLERDRGLSVTVRYSTTDLKFEYPEGRTSASGNTGGTATLVGVIPDIFYYQQFPTKLGKISAGLGIYIPYGGLAGSWDREVFGVAMDQMMAIASLTPSFSWAITPKVAVGAGMNVYFSFMRSKLTFDKIPVGSFLPDLAEVLPYVPLKFRQDSYAYGFSLGYNVGVLYKPSDWLSLGFTVRSGSKIKIDGPADLYVYLKDPLTVFLESDMTTEFTLPYLFVWGIALKPMPNLILVGDLQLNPWSTLDEIKVTFDRFHLSQASKTGYEDTVKFMVGAEYSFKKHFSVRLGYMYTPKNIKDPQYLSYQSWDTDVHNVSFGFGYKWTNFSAHFLAMISPGTWTTKPLDDPLDPDQKPAGDYSLLNQTYGVGCLWYF